MTYFLLAVGALTVATGWLNPDPETRAMSLGIGGGTITIALLHLWVQL